MTNKMCVNNALNRDEQHQTTQTILLWSRDWNKTASAMKRACCPSREPEFSSQLPLQLAHNRPRGAIWASTGTTFMCTWIKNQNKVF